MYLKANFYVFQKIFGIRMFLVNLLTTFLLSIVYFYSDISGSEFIFYSISLYFMNYFCLNKNSYVSSHYMWLFIFCGFLLNPSIELIYGTKNYYQNSYVIYFSIAIFSLGIISFFFSQFFSHKSKIVKNENSLSNINKLFVFFLIFFTFLTSAINFSELYYFRGYESSTFHNPVITNFFNLLFNMIIPIVAIFFIHNISKNVGNLEIFLLLFIIIVCTSSFGSRSGFLILFCIIYEAFRRGVKLTDLNLLAIAMLLIISLNIVEEKRTEVFKPAGGYVSEWSKNIDKDEGDKKTPAFSFINDYIDFNFIKLSYIERMFRRWVGADGVYIVQQKLSGLSEKEIETLKGKIINERKDKFGKNWYEPIKLISYKNQIYVNKFNVEANLNVTNLPGIIAFLTIFFSYSGVFLAFTIILLVIHLLEYLLMRVFYGNWLFASIITILLVNRIINFGIYFNDSYKLILAISLLCIMYGFLYYFYPKLKLHKDKI